MLQGTISFFRPDRGFGFVVPDDGGPDIFLHATGFAQKPGDFNFNPQGARVEFEMGENRRTGKPCAVNAKLLTPIPSSPDDATKGAASEQTN